MSEIDGTFQYFAVDCTECEQFGMMFSRSADATKTDLVKVPVSYS